MYIENITPVYILCLSLQLTPTNPAAATWQEPGMENLILQF